MSIEALTKVVRPPVSPSGVFLGPWEPLEAEIGVALPPDYKELVRVYGSGYWMEFFGLSVPRIENLNICLEYQIPLVCNSFRQLGTAAHLLWPAPGGLLPLGGTDNGDELFWLSRGPPAEWPIVVWDRGGEFETFEYDLTSFLAGVAMGEILPEAFPEDLVTCDHLFQPATANDLCWPPIRSDR